MAIYLRSNAPFSGGNWAFQIDWTFFSMSVSAGVFTRTAQNDDGTLTVITGIGFTFNAAGEPTGGTVSRIARFAADGTTEIEHISFSSGYPLTVLYNSIVGGGFPVSEMAGADAVVGGVTDDTLRGYGGNDLIDGREGSDVLFGGDGDDFLIGWRGDDTIIGDAGLDTADGGDGNDTYFVDNAGDTVLETSEEGFDTINTSVSYALLAGQEIEVLAAPRLGIVPINLTGNEFNQELQGSEVANLLDGGAGQDVLQGFRGDDLYYVDDAGDIVYEAARMGTDKVFASVSYALLADQSIEVLATTSQTGTGPINLTGNNYAQQLKGNNGDNILDGGGGQDVLYGFGGNDSYFVDHNGDKVYEAAGQGIDLVFASVSYALLVGQEIEGMATTLAGGLAPINLTGNEFAQTLLGNAGSNQLNGLLGSDILTGGAGNDTFYFTTTLGSFNVDTIMDFSVVDDTIRLENSVFTALPQTGALASAAFFIGAAAHDADDRIIYNAATGALLYDSDGTGTAAAVKFAQLATGLDSMTHGDFVVI